MSIITNIPASNLPIGIYRVTSINYPMAIADYKASISQNQFESVQIELAILYHPISNGPKEWPYQNLLRKQLHVIESGTKLVTRNFVLQHVDYAVWEILTRAKYDQLIAESQEPTAVSIIDLTKLSHKDGLQMYDKIKAHAANQLPLDDFEEMEQYDDMAEEQNDEIN